MFLRSEPNLKISLNVCPSGVNFGTVWRLHYGHPFWGDVPVEQWISERFVSCEAFGAIGSWVRIRWMEGLSLTSIWFIYICVYIYLFIYLLVRHIYCQCVVIVYESVLIVVFHGRTELYALYCSTWTLYIIHVVCGHCKCYCLAIVLLLLIGQHIKLFISVTYTHCFLDIIHDVSLFKFAFHADYKMYCQ
jgi:hypothetical protein